MGSPPPKLRTPQETEEAMRRVRNLYMAHLLINGVGLTAIGLIGLAVLLIN